MVKKSGYRRYSAVFKREQVVRVMRGEIAAAELSRELGVVRAVLPNSPRQSETVP
jgi:transposase-like protein